MAEPAVMQRENERNRIVVEGKRTDDGDKCTVVVVHEVIGDWWAIYPHGFDKFGVRLSKPKQSQWPVRFWPVWDEPQ